METNEILTLMNRKSAYLASLSLSLSLSETDHWVSRVMRVRLWTDIGFRIPTRTDLVIRLIPDTRKTTMNF